jgi:L-ascorbate metabolism protein UlaG (beta-lactamase superfamily)
LALAAALVVTILLSAPGQASDPPGRSGERQLSDHFDGKRFFNPALGLEQGTEAKRGVTRWVRRWIFGPDWPEWSEVDQLPQGPIPVARVPKGSLRITAVGHATFLIQMDGLNILTDPIWSERCSPFSWVGPKRHREPGIRFEDLPPIDLVLISHNHYDHLDLPTLRRLAETGLPRAVVPLGNGDLVRDTGIPAVEVLDWWEEVRITRDVAVTLVPAQHFSSRGLWDRNRTLWGGFVLSGPSGNVFFAGDTGYGPHFKEIARRFPGIRAALLPIAPYRPQQANVPSPGYPNNHMGPVEAVQAHRNLGAEKSVAAHFQVFQLGTDGFEDAVRDLAAVLKEGNTDPGIFAAPVFGQAMDLTAQDRLAYSSVSSGR